MADPTLPPFIDEISVAVPCPRGDVWTAVDRAATHGLCRGERSLIDVLWGTTDPGGFRVHRRVAEERIELRGGHRFSCYRLLFELEDAGDGATTLSARTYASFDGIHGRLYRLAVISTGLHVVATRALLRRIARSCG